MASVMLDAKELSVFIRSLALTGARARKAARKAARLKGDIPFDLAVGLLSEAIEEPSILIGALFKLSLTSGAIDKERCLDLCEAAATDLQAQACQLDAGESSTRGW